LTFLITARWGKLRNCAPARKQQVYRIVRVPYLFPAGLPLYRSLTTIGGVAASSVASFDPGGETWSALGGGLGGFGSNGGKVTALATSSFGLFAGGDFSRAGGHPSLSFARWTGAIEGGSGPVIDRDELTNHVYLPLIRR
jgi:hypothetical protein